MRLVIVDFEGTAHAQLMERCARSVAPALRIAWLKPDHLLPDRLSALADVRAVAIPLVVRGANPRDRFTLRAMAAIRELRNTGVEVFLSVPGRMRNPLAEAGVAVAAPRTLADALEQGGASGACVREAARHAANLSTHDPTSEATPWLSQST